GRGDRASPSDAQGLGDARSPSAAGDRRLPDGLREMGFEAKPEAQETRLRVFIEFDLPEGMPGRWLGRLLGAPYARWCVDRMLRDAVARFTPPAR
ncbi:MAG: hypothetical protein ACREJT_07095, partial [Myxococcota bacterium]